MSEQTTSTPGSDSGALNALVGAVAAVVLFFLPFQTLVGGAIAGYLQGPDSGEGLRVGALTGLFLLVPLVVLVLVFGAGVLAIGPFLSPEAFGVGALGFAVVVVLVLGAAYTVGLAALGGLLGAFLNREL